MQKVAHKGDENTAPTLAEENICILIMHETILRGELIRCNKDILLWYSNECVDILIWEQLLF